MAEAITQLRDQLPEAVLGRYQRLQQKNSLAVVPLANGACSQCRMAVPPGIINAVRAEEELQTCGHCGRFLYYQEGLPRQAKKAGHDHRPPQAGLARFSSAKLMIPKLQAKTREEAVGELAQLLASQGFVEEPGRVVELALRREAMVSTAVENGLAFPHVRNVEGGGLTFAVGLKEKGIDFGTPDGRLSKIIFFIVIPAPASAFYLRLLAGLVRTFSETDARKDLLECDTPEAMWKTLSKLTRQTIP
ncbi:MAG: PTS sugar transporter subunit IIA [Planctomycetes bacterium]|nr:PTS sugar transporter subunit IIA [Planctomycetota bacterium]